jgi:pyruvate formate lyase activating enzyme
VNTRRKLSRRDFLKLGGLGLCALGGGAILANPRWREGLFALADVGPGQPAPGSGTPPPLPGYAREAMYYTAAEESLDCTTCHTAAAPAKELYCHIPHGGSYAKCQLCPKGCVISEGQRGDCGVRENRQGRLYTMTYGNPCAVHADPIEKKPFYHFLPGSLAFSLATAGCNLHCQYCQNFEISQAKPEQLDNYDLPPEKVVGAAIQYECPVIAYTYSEPTVFYEYMLNSARLGRANGLRSVVISAGYINPGPLRELCHAVDAIKIDLKGFNEAFYRKVCDATLQPVLHTLETIAQEGVHLEIVNLVVPTLNDDEDEMKEMAHWIVERLGPDVPTHFSRFQPMYKLVNLPPTPVETLERLHTIAKEAGIRYAYIGNVPGHPADNTYCHRCGEMIIKREGFSIADYHITREGKCEYCGQPIPGVWSGGVAVKGEAPAGGGPSDY